MITRHAVLHSPANHSLLVRHYDESIQATVVFTSGVALSEIHGKRATQHVEEWLVNFVSRRGRDGNFYS